MDKVIISYAPTGTATSEPSLGFLEEYVKEAAAAASAGATVIRLAPRDASGAPSSDLAVLRRAMRMIQERSSCLIEVSTLVAPGAPASERAAVLSVKPDIGAVLCGSVNVGEHVLVQKADGLRQILSAARDQGTIANLVCFDMSHIYNARRMIDDGLVAPPYHFSLVLGAEGGPRGDVRTLLHLVDALPRGAVWTAAGVGKTSRIIGPASILMGGHPRIGFEEDPAPPTQAGGPAAIDLVVLTAHIASAIGRSAASVDETRALLTVR